MAERRASCGAASAGVCPSRPLSLVLALSVAVALAPKAAAVPAFPDLSGYTEADGSRYRARSPMHWGYFFFTGPGGLRCRIMWGDGHPSTAGAPACWGALPGVRSGMNAVAVPLSGKSGIAQPAFRHEDDLPQAFETWSRVVREDGSLAFADRPIPAEKFVPLEAGQKLTYLFGQVKTSCAVTEAGAMACAVYEVDDSGAADRPLHGFVLSGEGSATF